MNVFALFILHKKQSFFYLFHEYKFSYKYLPNPGYSTFKKQSALDVISWLHCYHVNLRTAHVLLDLNVKFMSPTAIPSLFAPCLLFNFTVTEQNGICFNLRIRAPIVKYCDVHMNYHYQITPRPSFVDTPRCRMVFLSFAVSHEI
jgi:hypothetical protein